jgi:hypothetical protein
MKRSVSFGDVDPVLLIKSSGSQELGDLIETHFIPISAQKYVLYQVVQYEHTINEDFFKKGNTLEAFCRLSGESFSLLDLITIKKEIKENSFNIRDIVVFVARDIYSSYVSQFLFKFISSPKTQDLKKLHQFDCIELEESEKKNYDTITCFCDVMKKVS